MTTATFQLSDVAELITKGTTPPKSMGGFSDVGVNYIKSESLSYSGAVDVSNLVKVSPEVHQKLKRSQLKENDILYSIAGANLGKCGIVPSEILPANTNQAVAIIRLDKTQADARFVSLFLRNPRFVRGVLAGVAQSAQPNVNLSDIGRYELPAFGLPEQKAIGDALGALDDKIELNRRMNETLEEMARALFRDWFVDFGPTRRQIEGATDPASIMGQAFRLEKAATLTPLFPAKLGDDGLPEGWVDRPLSELTLLLKRGAAPKYAEAGCLVVNQKCIRNSAINYKLARRNDLSLRDPKLKELQIGDVLVNSTGVGTLGRVATVRVLPERAMADTHVSIVRPDPDLVDPSIVALLLETLQNRIADMGHGSTGQTELKPSVIGEIHATIASWEIQNAFGHMVGQLRKKSDANQQENQTLAEMRDLLLPKLMSGEICLKNVEVVV